MMNLRIAAAALVLACACGAVTAGELLDSFKAQQAAGDHIPTVDQLAEDDIYLCYDPGFSNDPKIELFYSKSRNAVVIAHTRTTREGTSTLKKLIRLDTPGPSAPAIIGLLDFIRSRDYFNAAAAERPSQSQSEDNATLVVIRKKPRAASHYLRNFTTPTELEENLARTLKELKALD